MPTGASAASSPMRNSSDLYAHGAFRSYCDMDYICNRHVYTGLVSFDANVRLTRAMTIVVDTRCAQHGSCRLTRVNNQTRSPLSAQLWGISLTAELPKVISSDGIVAVAGDLGRIGEFLGRVFPSMREDEAALTRSQRICDAKNSYLQDMCDLIELRQGHTTVGTMIGVPLDWSSYYVRVLAFAPDIQRPALTRRFVRECLFEPLRARQVERVEADTSPNNLAMSRGLLETHFVCTGNQLTERWGPVVRYTKFLDPAFEAAFHRQFSRAAPPCSVVQGKEDSP